MEERVGGHYHTSIDISQPGNYRGKDWGNVSLMWKYVTQGPAVSHPPTEAPGWPKNGGRWKKIFGGHDPKPSHLMKTQRSRKSDDHEQNILSAINSAIHLILVEC